MLLPLGIMGDEAQRVTPSQTMEEMGGGAQNAGRGFQNPSGPLKVYEVPITWSHRGHFSAPELFNVYHISSL